MLTIENAVQIFFDFRLFDLGRVGFSAFFPVVTGHGRYPCEQARRQLDDEAGRADPELLGLRDPGHHRGIAATPMFGSF